MKTNRGALFLVFLICGFSFAFWAIPAARAQVAPPEGWTVQARPDDVLMTSAANPAGEQAYYLIFKPETVPNRARAWFIKRTGDVAALVGRMTEREFVTTRAYFQDRFTAVSDDGQTIYGFVLGYGGGDTGEPFQTMAIIWPSTFAKANGGHPAINAALNHFKTLRNSGFLLAGDAPIGAGAAVGSNAPFADIESWGAYQTEAAHTRTSPCSADGAQVAFTFLPAWALNEPLDAWLRHKIGSLLSGWSDSGVSPNPPQGSEGAARTASVAFRDRAGRQWSAWFWAADRNGRGQFAAVVAPASIGAQDLRVSAAIEHVRNQMAGGFTLLPEQAAIASRPSLNFVAGAKVTAAAASHGIKLIGTGYLGSNADTYVMLDNGRVFITTEGAYNASSSQGTWRKTAKGYDIAWPDRATKETIAASCVGGTAPSRAAPAPGNTCLKFPMTVTYPHGGTLTVWTDQCN